MAATHGSHADPIGWVTAVAAMAIAMLPIKAARFCVACDMLALRVPPRYQPVEH
jgi:hypothetical protein